MSHDARDELGECWRRSAARFEPIARLLAAATGWRIVNPGAYGERWHARFRRLYPWSSAPLLFFGLNPGPYGMAQTGIPFTDLKRLESHLPRLRSDLVKAGESLALPGLAPAELAPWLTRTFESSSVRVYRFLNEAFGSAEAAFREVVFVNPCPLLFMEEEPEEESEEEPGPARGRKRATASRGANRTPADLPRALRAAGRRDAAELVREFDGLRRATVLEAVTRLEPRGAVLLGRDVAAVLGADLVAVLGARNVLEWEHPARAVPSIWARELRVELTRRGLLTGARTRARAARADGK